ncbi:hypothetical protein OROMI_019542 [Orobanche minor]
MRVEAVKARLCPERFFAGDLWPESCSAPIFGLIQVYLAPFLLVERQRWKRSHQVQLADAGILKRMKADFVDLSRDLVCEILCRLDSKTLFNCCKVCKTWFHIISDASFAHLRRQFMLTNSKLVVVDQWRPSKTCSGKAAFSFTMYMDGWMKGASKEDSLVTSRILQNDEVGYPYFNRMYFNRFTCDMLLFYDSQTAYLLNPRTGELHVLPGYYSTTCTDLQRIQYTYGYIASKTEYVLVASEWVDEQHVRVAKLSFTIGKTCSGWKVIWDASFPREAGACLGIILNNHAYWPSEGNLPCSEGKEIIVSMDLDYSDSTNAFCIIKSPPFIPEIGLCFKDYGISVIDFKGSLGMIDVKHMYSTNTLVLWILTDRSSSSWIKKFHINLGRTVPAIYVRYSTNSSITVGLKTAKEGELIICPDEFYHNRSYYILNPERHTAEHVVVPTPHPSFIAAGSFPDPSLLGAAFF